MADLGAIGVATPCIGVGTGGILQQLEAGTVKGVYGWDPGGATPTGAFKVWDGSMLQPLAIVQVVA